MNTFDRLRREQAKREAERGDKPRRYRTKERAELEEKHRRLVARAFKHGLRVSRNFDEKYFRFSLDFDGAMAERLVAIIGQYDRNKSSLKAWSYSHANFACLDLLRKNVFVGTFVRGDKENRNPEVYSIEAITEWRARFHKWDSRKSEPSLLAKSDPVTPLESEDALSHLLRGLDQRERDMMVLYYRDDLPMHEIGRRLGYSESRISQMHSSVIHRLRERQKSA